MGVLGAPPFLQTLALLADVFLPRLSWSLSLFLSWAGAIIIRLIRSGREGSLPVWKGLFILSSVVSRARHQTMWKGCAMAPVPSPEGKGTSAEVSVPPQRRRAWWGAPQQHQGQDCAPELGCSCLPCETHCGGASMVSTSAPRGLDGGICCPLCCAPGRAPP